jgi:pimeloyl-ACP methyl ester carboxylesterase
MFPGGEGANHFWVREGRIHLGKNFLVRSSPEFVKRGFAIAIVDVPSDRPKGMTDTFRNSPKHAQDIEKAIEFLAGQGLQPVYLVGTSRGTLSVAYLGIALKDERIKGIVLTSSLPGILLL